ncbi:hypothetical protein YB2330_001759 [Saitoella coloradoensis]
MVPSTDQGSTPEARWPLALSHNRLENGGWARQQNVDQLPAATEMAGVNMRLAPGAYRELHWHVEAEWAYMLNGSARISAIDANGQNFVDDIYEGDFWYFPRDFNDDDTFLVTDWLAHTPKEVIAKDLNVSISDLQSLPSSELYIFPGQVPNTTANASLPTSPNGLINPTFPVAKTIAMAEVIIQPGAMRELHWHPNSAEWNYFISSSARITVFAASWSSRTFDYHAGDVGYIPQSNGHYIETIGDETVRLLGLLKADTYKDVALG